MCLVPCCGSSLLQGSLQGCSLAVARIGGFSLAGTAHASGLCLAAWQALGNRAVLLSVLGNFTSLLQQQAASSMGGELRVSCSGLKDCIPGCTRAARSKDQIGGTAEPAVTQTAAQREFSL